MNPRRRKQPKSFRLSPKHTAKLNLRSLEENTTRTRLIEAGLDLLFALPKPEFRKAISGNGRQ
jgi:hypothetical protein